MKCRVEYCHDDVVVAVVVGGGGGGSCFVVDVVVDVLAVVGLL